MMMLRRALTALLCIAASCHPVPSFAGTTGHVSPVDNGGSGADSSITMEAYRGTATAKGAYGVGTAGANRCWAKIQDTSKATVEAYGAKCNVDVTSTRGGVLTPLAFGTWGHVKHSGSGEITTIYGARGWAELANAASNADNMYGLHGKVSKSAGTCDYGSVLELDDPGSACTEQWGITSRGGLNRLVGAMTLGSLDPPTTDAILDLDTTDAAFLPPRLTTTQRNALTPTEGMVIYNLTTQTVEQYDGAVWVGLTQVYPGSGIPLSTGSAWGASYSTTGSGAEVALSAGPTFTGTVAGASLSLSSLTLGRIPFAATAGLLDDDAVFGWDDTNKRLQIGRTGNANIRSLDVYSTTRAVANFERDSNIAFGAGSNIILVNPNTSAAPLGITQAFQFNDGGPTLRNSAYIGAEMTARAAATTTADIVFSTANAANTPTERWRVKADGTLLPTALYAVGSVDNGVSSVFIEEPGGGDTMQLVSPALAADIVVTGPSAAGTLATLAGSEALSNKTIDTSNIGVTTPGTGKFATLTRRAGSGTDYGTALVTLYSDSAVVGNVGTGVDTLMDYPLPASSQTTAGQFVKIHATFTTAVNANNKTITVDYGGTTVWTVGPSAYSGVTFSVEILISRLTASQQAFATTHATTGAFPLQYAALSESNASDILIKGTGTGTSNDDVRQFWMDVQYGSNP